MIRAVLVALCVLVVSGCCGSSPFPGIESNTPYGDIRLGERSDRRAGRAEARRIRAELREARKAVDALPTTDPVAPPEPTPETEVTP